MEWEKLRKGVTKFSFKREEGRKKMLAREESEWRGRKKRRRGKRR